MEIKFTPIHNGKMLTETNVREAKARAYSHSVSMKRKREIRRIRGIAVGLVVATGIFTGMVRETAASKVGTEQKYIVRYGIASDFGATIETEDGNVWEIEDAPEFEDGTMVRVIYDSCETETPMDDIIIDISER